MTPIQLELCQGIPLAVGVEAKTLTLMRNIIARQTLCGTTSIGFVRANVLTLAGKN
jgi:hypothetical protein